MAATHDRNKDNHAELQLDKVLSSQPELGPSVPDGGYGWVILIASAFFQGLIPSISVGLGIFALFWRIEYNAPLDPTLWDCKIVYVSLFFIAIWTISEPWSRTLSISSNWPRLVATAGTCLTCASLLVTWIAVNKADGYALFLLAGLLAGIGASIVMSQTEILISQYFNLKLEAVTTILNAAKAVGFVIVPVALGHNIVRLGILQVITWYQAIILQGILVSIAFRKPKYLKSQRRKYKLIRGISDDEEDIFAKNTTELQNPRRLSTIARTEAVIETASSSANNSTNLQDEIKEATSNSAWVNFEEGTTNHVQTKKTRTSLHETFAPEFSNDLDKIEQFEDNYVETPKPLFSELHINNNTSYSYEESAEVEDPVVFMPVTTAPQVSAWRRDIEFLKQPTFYKSLLFVVTTKLSIFIFWTLFPAYLYLRIDALKLHQASIIVGCVGIGSLLFTTLSMWIKSNANIRAIYLWIFCWIGAVGFLVLSGSNKEIMLIFSAISITLSISALQILGTPLMKLNLRGETSRAHTILCTLAGVSLLLLLIINMSYQSCFRFMALLQFLTGSLWFSNFIYKRIKKRMSRR